MENSTDRVQLWRLFLQPMRIVNTWMGDQSKLVLLKEVVKVIEKDNLLQRVQESGRVLLKGLENLQVIT